MGMYIGGIALGALLVAFATVANRIRQILIAPRIVLSICSCDTIDVWLHA